MATPTTITGAEIGLLSYLFEAVGDLLTDAQRKQLTDQLTSLRPAGVAPGDLITAELFNGMLNNVNDLMARVAVLEGAEGGPVITGILPNNQTIFTSSIMSVNGLNFDVEPNRNLLRLGEAVITQFIPGSSESVLRFTVPAIFTGLPKTVEAIVETGGKRSNPFPVPLNSPPRQQIGKFDVSLASFPPGPMLQGATIRFEWDVFADTMLDDELRLQLSVGNLAGATAAQWRSALSFNPAAPVRIANRSTVRIGMTVTAPATATRADISLRVLGIDDQATGSPLQPVEWIKDEPIESSSKLAGLDFVIGTISAPGAMVVRTNVDVNGLIYPKIVQIKQGASGSIRFTRKDNRTTGNEQAIYQFSSNFEISDGKFRVTTPPTPPSHPGALPGSSDLFSIAIANISGNVGDLNFLNVAANQTVNSPTLPQFKSFVSIPIIITA